jgi:hypothetical protein
LAIASPPFCSMINPQKTLKGFIKYNINSSQENNFINSIENCSVILSNCFAFSVHKMSSCFCSNVEHFIIFTREDKFYGLFVGVCVCVLLECIYYVFVKLSLNNSFLSNPYWSFEHFSKYFPVITLFLVLPCLIILCNILI